MDNKRKFAHLALGIFASAIATAEATIYFNAKVIGPVTNIYSVNTRGTVKKLTDNDAWRDLEPSISSRGDIVFSSNREPKAKIDMQRKSEVFNIYVSYRHAKTLQQLTNHTAHEISPKFSPNGQWIAYLRATRSSERELRLIRRDGTGEFRLAKADQLSDYSWSPDSKEIVFAEMRNRRPALSIANIRSGKIRRLAATAAPAKSAPGKSATAQSHLLSPQWSPDGDSIAYIKHPLAANEFRELFVLNLPSGRHIKISPEKTQVQAPPVWSRNSKQLLYSALVNYQYRYDDNIHRKVYSGGMHIFLSEPGGATRQITQGDHLHTRPVFSPDEQYIAYLYAEKLGDARAFSLRTMATSGEGVQELYPSVARQSSIIWR